jgi:hypothetical protein
VVVVMALAVVPVVAMVTAFGTVRNIVPVRIERGVRARLTVRVLAPRSQSHYDHRYKRHDQTLHRPSPDLSP